MTHKAILVLGMHRSGTSAVTGTIVQGGVSAPKTPLPPSTGNPKGYWESRPLVNFHNRMLSRIGVGWDSWDAAIETYIHEAFTEADRAELRSIVSAEFAGSSLFVIKDPRLALFLPVWIEEAPKMDVILCPVLVLRSPVEVALSLERRDQLDIDTSILIWLRYNLLAERLTRNQPRCVLAFDDFIRNSRPALAQLASRFGFEWDEHRIDPQPIIDPKLRHHVNEDFGKIHNSHVRTLALNAHLALQRLATHYDSKAMAVLDAVAESMDRLLDCDATLRPLRGTITKVSKISQAPGLRGYYLDRPRNSALISNGLIDVIGWAVAESGNQLQQVEMWHDGTLVATASADALRPDVAAVIPDLPHADRSGFRLRTRIRVEQPNFILKLIARLRRPSEQDQLVTIGEISGCLSRVTTKGANDFGTLAAHFQPRSGQSATNAPSGPAIDHLPSNHIDKYIRISKELAALDQLDLAIELLERVLARDPKQADAAVSLAIIYRRSNQHEQAVQIFLSIADQHPDWLSLRLEIAFDLQSLGRDAEASELLKAYLWNEPGHPGARTSRYLQKLASKKPKGKMAGFFWARQWNALKMLIQR